MSKSIATCHTPQIIKRIVSLGLTRRSATVALRVTLAALRTLLMDGENVSLPTLGKMVFIKRNGRHHPGNGFTKGPVYQKPSHSIKFEMDPTFRAEIKKAVPKKPKMPHHWKGRKDGSKVEKNFVYVPASPRPRLEGERPPNTSPPAGKQSQDTSTSSQGLTADAVDKP